MSSILARVQAEKKFRRPASYSSIFGTAVLSKVRSQGQVHQRLLWRSVHTHITPCRKNKQLTKSFLKNTQSYFLLLCSTFNDMGPKQAHAVLGPLSRTRGYFPLNKFRDSIECIIYTKIQNQHYRFLGQHCLIFDIIRMHQKIKNYLVKK